MDYGGRERGVKSSVLYHPLHLPLPSPHFSVTCPARHLITTDYPLSRPERKDIKKDACVSYGGDTLYSFKNWWFNSCSYCTSQSFTIENQSKQLMCSHRTVQSLSSHCTGEKVCWLMMSDLSIDDNNANKAEVCAVLFAETSKKGRCWHIHIYTHRCLGRWFFHFAEQLLLLLLT